jgi:PIN domain nuclease of toxin-antitoxin system
LNTSGRLLLDTCAIIWIVEDMPVGEEAARAIDEAAAEGGRVLISPITAWERAILIAKGRLSSTLEPKRWFERLLARPEVALAAMSPDILTDASFLPGSVHGDPADRIIIATARALDLTIVTRDRAILDYAKQGHVRALAC